LLAEFRRAETRSGAIQAFFVQKRFELRSAIATKFLTGIIYLINNSLEFCKAKLRGPSSPPISEPQQLKKLYWRSGGNGFS